MRSEMRPKPRENFTIKRIETALLDEDAEDCDGGSDTGDEDCGDRHCSKYISIVIN